MTTAPINTYLTERRKIVDKHLNKILHREADHQLKKLMDSMEYTLMANGKRLRPIIAIAVYELFGSNIRDVVEPACAVELIHSASLMLDDLPCMDNAGYRRGKPANHLVHGESTAILASAALWVTAFKIFSQIKLVEINSIVKETADSIGHMGLIRGQFLDIQSFNRVRTIKDLEKCYYLKTGLLFQNAAKIGALMGQAKPSEIKILEKFGMEFGLAFQIKDDILDAESTFTESGKDIGIDKRNLKPTYVSLLGIMKAKEVLNKKINSICKNLSKLRLKTDNLIALTRNLATS